MSETARSQYIVIVESSHTTQASIGKLNYSGERYEIVASGKYSDVCGLVAALNRAGRIS